MLCYVYSALPRSFAAPTLSYSLSTLSLSVIFPLCHCRCFTFIYIVRRVAAWLRSRRLCWLFAILLLARSLGHMSNAPRFRVFCFARDLTLLYFTFTLRYVTYSFRYVTLLLVKRFLSFFIVILVFCFCALLLISVFILIPPRAFIALGRSFIFARILSPISLSFAFVFIFLCLLIGARAAGCVQLNSILI